jgi:hypothetical protein
MNIAGHFQNTVSGRMHSKSNPVSGRIPNVKLPLDNPDKYPAGRISDATLILWHFFLVFERR